MDTPQRPGWGFSWMILFLVIGLVGGVIFDQRVLAPTAQTRNLSTGTQAQFSLMEEAWSKVHQIYVDQSAIKDQDMTYAAISGMVQSLGDTGHSTFLTPEMLKQEQNQTRGEFEGIGVQVEMRNNQVTIVAPIDDTPAQKAGLKAGDVIIKVDGVDITGLTLNEVINKVLGPAGTKVMITILDPKTNKTKDYELIRARIVIHNVTWTRIPGTDYAHLRIVMFSQGVTNDLKTALQELESQGIKGIVLDLRNNPGGLLDEGVGTASQFLKSGNVLLEKDAQGKTTPIPIKSGGVATDIPMVVLINAGTASASEIVSGSLQDYGRAKLIGETTFGTGTVLGTYPLSDGSALLLAISEWLTPNGRVIWHHGIAPDVQVSLPTDVTQLTPEAETGMTLDQIQASNDTQLLKAIDMLQGK